MFDDVLSLRSGFFDSCGDDFLLSLAGIALSVLALLLLCVESSLGGGVGAVSLSSACSSSSSFRIFGMAPGDSSFTGAMPAVLAGSAR